MPAANLRTQLTATESLITACLKLLAGEIERAIGDRGHFLGDGYGAEHTNHIFEMHPYTEADCDCGHDAAEWKLEETIPHEQGCSELTEQDLADLEALIASSCSCSRAKSVAAWYAEHDHNPACVIVRPNFLHRPTGVEVRWTKYIGRSMQVTGPQQFAHDWMDVIGSCVDSLTPSLAKQADPISELADHLVDQDTAMHSALVRARVASGLTVEQVAERMGVSVDTVRQFERYDADPNLSTIRRYALAVGARVSHTVNATGGVSACSQAEAAAGAAVPVLFKTLAELGMTSTADRR
ncbi:helix-turn-helix domain-containing protein [Agromyces sp. NPDC057679]|uniref:helix-turn-helix domain-containing protein n=1 Tax=Agromyces sp. NPDC057679 TaxID=3346207 RepID=UPI0036718ED1